MNISVFGLGYVGTVSAACLARDGHEVVGIDVSQQKIDTINAARSSIEEVLAQSEVLVVTNGSQTFHRLLAQADENQIVIDLVGTGKPNGADRNGNYQGICW